MPGSILLPTISGLNGTAFTCIHVNDRGYTICFISDGRVQQVTMANADDNLVVRALIAHFGKIQILSRTPLDANTLEPLQLKRGEWIEWAHSHVSVKLEIIRG